MSSDTRWITAKKAALSAARGTSSHQALLLRAVRSSALSFALACGYETSAPEIALHPPATLTPMPEIAAADPFVCQVGAAISFNGYPRLAVNRAILAPVNGGTQLSISAFDRRPNPFLMPVEDVFGFCTRYAGSQTTGITQVAYMLDQMESSALRGFGYEYDAADNRLGISFSFDQMGVGSVGDAGPQSRPALVLRAGSGSQETQHASTRPITVSLLLGGAVVGQLTISAAQQGQFTGAYVLLVPVPVSATVYGSDVMFIDASVGVGFRDVGHIGWSSPFAVCPGGARDDIAACLASGGSTALMIDEIRVTDAALPPGRIVRSILAFSALAPGARVLLSETVVP